MQILDTFLLLSIVLMISFNLFFRISFECILTSLNEITGLEIELYEDWWNSADSAEFWRKWNIPMHLFIKEHIYLECLGRNFNVRLSRFFCSVFSGLFHDIIISIGFRKFSLIFTVLMVIQLLLTPLTSFIKKRSQFLANFFFLFSFCVIGQTGGFVLLYRLGSE